MADKLIDLACTILVERPLSVKVSTYATEGAWIPKSMCEIESALPSDSVCPREGYITLMESYALEKGLI